MSVLALGFRLLAAFELTMFAAFSGYFGLQEAQFHLASYQVESEIDPAPLDYGTLSLSADNSKLSICDANHQFIAAGLFQAESIEHVVEKCSTLASRILRTAPTHSFAHIIAAIAAYPDAGRDVFEFHMSRSQQFGRFEGWLSQRRYFYLSRLVRPEASPLLERETATMVTFQQGAETLASELLRSPSMQPIILSAVKVSDPIYQQRFINLIGSEELAR